MKNFIDEAIARFKLTIISLLATGGTCFKYLALFLSAIAFSLVTPFVSRAFFAKIHLMFVNEMPAYTIKDVEDVIEEENK